MAIYQTAGIDRHLHMTVPMQKTAAVGAYNIIQYAEYNLHLYWPQMLGMLTIIINVGRNIRQGLLHIGFHVSTITIVFRYTIL